MFLLTYAGILNVILLLLNVKRSFVYGLGFLSDSSLHLQNANVDVQSQFHGTQIGCQSFDCNAVSQCDQNVVIMMKSR